MPDEMKLNAIKNTSLLVVWRSEYNLGIPIIDEQHRGIVTAINSLYYGMQNKYTKIILAPIADMVSNYTHIHFGIEEAFLEKYNFAGIQHHRQLHKELIDTLFKVRQESTWNQDPSHFLEFLKRWWIDHICDKDRVFRDYLFKNPDL